MTITDYDYIMYSYYKSVLFSRACFEYVLEHVSETICWAHFPMKLFNFSQGQDFTNIMRSLKITRCHVLAH